jgi:hypothetical protein
MTLDIRAIAYADAPTMAVGLATMAKQRIELDQAIRAAEVMQAPVTSENAAEGRALLKLAATVEPPHAVDKVA